MKRALVASILGIAASIGTSYGQANFFFSTYLPATGYGPVRWTTEAAFAPVGQAGMPVADAAGVLADVMWSYTSGGTVTGDANVALPTVTIPGYGPGYINGGNYGTAANYLSGSPISFTIAVWQGGTSWNNGQGHAATGTLTWTETAGFAAGAGPVAWNSYPGGLTISLVPEPTTMALAGLGLAGMLIFRRRQ